MILLMQSFTAHYPHPHAISGGNQGIRIIEKMLEFSSTAFYKSTKW